jgi:hypothetical protein
MKKINGWKKGIRNWDEGLGFFERCNDFTQRHGV